MRRAALEDAGCFAIVLEAIPAPLAAAITARVSVPTIGIGAGADCDGQVLVLHDMLGLYSEFTPRFVKRYAELGTLMEQAVRDYAEEVRSGAFPIPAHSFSMDKEERARLEDRLQQNRVTVFSLLWRWKRRCRSFILRKRCIPCVPSGGVRG